MSDVFPEGRHRIEDLYLPSSVLDVWGAESRRDMPGWRLHEVDVAMKEGRPFGSVLFERLDNRSARVGVRWNHVSEQLHCFVTDATISGADRQGLELDVRARVGALMAINAAIGASAATSPVAASGVRAAAHLLPELPPATG